MQKMSAPVKTEGENTVIAHKDGFQQVTAPNVPLRRCEGFNHGINHGCQIKSDGAILGSVTGGRAHHLGDLAAGIQSLSGCQESERTPDPTAVWP